MALGVYQDVFGFEIAVGGPFYFVEKFEDEDDFGSVEDRGSFIEAARAPKVGEDFAARAVI